MPAFLTKDEERKVRALLDEMATRYGLRTSCKESYFPGFYIDRVWYTNLESVQAAVVAFEIERSVPSNERFRKDILNLATSRASLGFIVLPHARILNATEGKMGGWPRWYRNSARSCLEVYARPFQPYISIGILDADKLLSTGSLDKAGEILWTRRVKMRGRRPTASDSTDAAIV